MSEAQTALLAGSSTTGVAVQDPDWSARVDADRHGPVWAVAKQQFPFGTQQVHSGQTERGG